MRPLAYIFEPKQMNCSSPSSFFRCKSYQWATCLQLALLFDLIKSPCLLSLFCSTLLLSVSMISLENSENKALWGILPHPYIGKLMNKQHGWHCSVSVQHLSPKLYAEPVSSLSICPDNDFSFNFQLHDFLFTRYWAAFSLLLLMSEAVELAGQREEKRAI